MFGSTSASPDARSGLSGLRKSVSHLGARRQTDRKTARGSVARQSVTHRWEHNENAAPPPRWPCQPAASSAVSLRRRPLRLSARRSLSIDNMSSLLCYATLRVSLSLAEQLCYLAANRRYQSVELACGGVRLSVVEVSLGDAPCWSPPRKTLLSCSDSLELNGPTEPRALGRNQQNPISRPDGAGCSKLDPAPLTCTCTGPNPRLTPSGAERAHR